MKKIVSIIIIVFVSLNLNAQEKTTEKDSVKKSSIDSSKVKTLDSTIKTLYAVISGEKGIERNWDLFKFLFKSDAKLIPSGKDNDGVYKVRYMSPEDYIKSSGDWLFENGFDPSNPQLSLGYLKLGEVDLLNSFGTANAQDIWQQMGNYLDIYKIECGTSSATYDYHWSESNHEQRQLESLQ